MWFPKCVGQVTGYAELDNQKPGTCHHAPIKASWDQAPPEDRHVRQIFVVDERILPQTPGQCLQLGEALCRRLWQLLEWNAFELVSCQHFLSRNVCGVPGRVRLWGYNFFWVNNSCIQILSYPRRTSVKFFSRVLALFLQPQLLQIQLSPANLTIAIH